MTGKNPETVFTPETLEKLFPADRADAFFDAMFGDASEGAYDIALRFDGAEGAGNQLRFSLCLHERPGKCLACNLTYGLPEVFSRHPIINIKGLVAAIAGLMAAAGADWRFETTRIVSKNRHEIPLVVSLKG